MFPLQYIVYAHVQTNVSTPIMEGKVVEKLASIFVSDAMVRWLWFWFWVWVWVWVSIKDARYRITIVWS